MPGNNLSEEIIYQGRPAFRSHIVFLLGIAITIGGPILKEDSPLPPWLGFLVSAIFALMIFRRWSHQYTITTQEICVKGGLFTHDNAIIPVQDIISVEANLGMTLRMMGVGHLLIQSKQPDVSTMVLFGIPNPNKVRARLEKLAEIGADLEPPIAADDDL